jgi:hypothetical protein
LRHDGMCLVWQDRKLTHTTDREAPLLLLFAVRPMFEQRATAGLIISEGTWVSEAGMGWYGAARNLQQRAGRVV